MGVVFGPAGLEPPAVARNREKMWFSVVAKLKTENHRITDIK